LSAGAAAAKFIALPKDLGQYDPAADGIRIIAKETQTSLAP